MASSPTAWRRWLANEMRRMREEAGLGQKDVARKLRCTVTKVSYIETGVRSFKLIELEDVLLPLYGVPESEWPHYLDACKRSKERGWWEYYDPDIVPEWVQKYLGLEQGAKSLRSFMLQFPHGLVQTRGYAEGLMARDPAQLTDDEIKGRVEVREKRQTVLSRAERLPTGETRDAPLKFHSVMDEAILRRAVRGGPALRRTLIHRPQLPMGRRSRCRVSGTSFQCGIPRR
jgi:transcriptional regulator with XRE-family HTH domain